MSINYDELSRKLIISWTVNDMVELISENKQLKDQLSHTNQELDGIYHIIDATPNDRELGKRVREYYWSHTEEVEEDEPVYIYESPDNGKTLYRRKFGDYATNREQVEEVVDDLEELPVSRERAQARLDYLNSELAHEQYHDGWTIKGMEDEKEWLENQLGGEQMELDFEE